MTDARTPDPRPFGAHAPTGFARWTIERTRTLPDRWAARRLAFMLRHLAVRSLGGSPLDVETLGARMRLYPYNNVCEKRILFTPQFFDPEERAILESRIREGFAFVDIGANVGAYSLFVAARAGSSARILAVEPQPDIFDRLTYNIRQNPFGTVKAVACAVADKGGELTLFLDPRNSGESSVKIVGSGEAHAIRVPAVTLVDLLREEGFARLDAVKIDVEGAEDLILDPFFRDAPEDLHPSLVIIEDGRGQWQIDLPALLEEKGYRLIAQTRLNLVYERG
ncbi:MAG TPA: FkbM family methyltransferase [Microvirga sp.]